MDKRHREVILLGFGFKAYSGDGKICKNLLDEATTMARNQTKLNLMFDDLVAVNAISKQTITLCNDSYVNAEVIADFLTKLKREADNSPIVIVLDGNAQLMLVTNTVNMSNK